LGQLRLQKQKRKQIMDHAIGITQVKCARWTGATLSLLANERRNQLLASKTKPSTWRQKRILNKLTQHKNTTQLINKYTVVAHRVCLL
jgi:predicted transcriptional regulator